MTDDKARTTTFEDRGGSAARLTRPEASPKPQLVAGDRLGDRYVLLGELGSGGFGSVWRAKDLQLDREVALKLLHGFAQSVSTDVVEAVLKEGRALARLQHANVVPVFDAGRFDSLPFLSMGLVRGRPLNELVQAEGTLDLDRAVSLAEQLCAALDHAHDASLIHRDVKPVNVLVDDEDGLQLVDFGIALRAQADDERSSFISGTVGYIAPEILQGEAPSARSDQFAAAVTFYEMIAGTRAYSSRTPKDYVSEIQRAPLQPLSRLPESVPAGVRQVLERAFSPDPVARFASCGEFAGELRRVVEAPRRRRRLLTAAAVLIAAVATLIVAWPKQPLEIRSELRGLVETREGVRVEISVDDRAALTAGDWFWLDGVEVTRPAHVVVVLLDAVGELFVLCPGPSCELDVLEPGRQHRLPPEGQPSWQLDDSTGFESLFLVASEDPVTAAQISEAAAEAEARLRADRPRTRGVRTAALPDSLAERVSREEELVEVLAKRFDHVRRHRIAHE